VVAALAQASAKLPATKLTGSQATSIVSQIAQIRSVLGC
jgi:hypothetical protein